MCYHYSAQVISRADGRSAVAAAAYRATEKLVDMRTGETHDFSKKEQATFSQIMMPENAPARFQNRAVLWNEVEANEKRKDSQLAREFNIALPNEMSDSQQVDLMREFVQLAFVEKGMIADINLHSNVGNPHFHAMVTMRSVSAEGFGQKNRDWNKKELLLEWRKLWADVGNAHLVSAGHEARLDHRTLEAQGIIEREPQIHHGGHAVRIERNDAIIERNALVIDLYEQLVDVQALLAKEAKIVVPTVVPTPIHTPAPVVSYQEAYALYQRSHMQLVELELSCTIKPDYTSTRNSIENKIRTRAINARKDEKYLLESAQIYKKQRLDELILKMNFVQRFIYNKLNVIISDGLGVEIVELQQQILKYDEAIKKADSAVLRAERKDYAQESQKEYDILLKDNDVYEKLTESIDELKIEVYKHKTILQEALKKSPEIKAQAHKQESGWSR